jgi:hypothetical protein
LKTDNAGSWVPQTLSNRSSASAVFMLGRGHTYQFAARAKNASGQWGAWSYSALFSVGEYQENYLTTNPTLTGSWTRTAWTPASDGFLTISSTAGDRAKFTFTGTSVAWIATRAVNRGQADVYVDGIYMTRVDLYSATTSAQAVAYTRSWSTSGTHTLEIRVVGTAARPKVDIDAFVRLR